MFDPTGKEVSYFDEDVKCIGKAFISNNEKKLPAVLVAHTWKGRSEFEDKKALELSKLGYVGFSIDLFGNKKNGSSVEENQGLIEPFVVDRNLLRQRVLSAVEFISNQTYVDATKIGLIGFCFGGMAVIEAARSGQHLSGIVSFHGLLQKSDLPVNKINTQLLICHGDKDPMVSREDVSNFVQEMDVSNANWELISYGNAMHAFTNPDADDKDFGTVYDKQADKRSWNSMKDFFERVFENEG